ncbi:CoA transferase [Sphingomonas glaciei]|uniref:CoA transferase n=1 Tax=Sphingomonas glaciei TaxID=2938948 RepID=A0ABY5MRT9_9SPHN|nr:CoA transferase [Sphingomonas glaciei]UUR06848.1 CoA transferase [Sphingomonas glaciei]
MSVLLSHLLVVDLTDELGAIAGRMLAELGAEVRRPAGGAAAWNHGKQPLDPSETQVMLGKADIVLRGPGLDNQAVAAANPKLIDVVIAPFLPGGPNSERPETDLTLMARSGLMTIVGDPDRPPLTLPGQQAYALAGIQAVIGALTALRARATSGRGQLVEVSAYQSAVLANYREPLTWGWTGRIGKRTGNLLIRGKSGVRQVWPCKDGWVTWALVDNPPMMRAMVELLGDLAGPLAAVDWDTVLVADIDRETLIEWEEVVAAFFLTHTRAELGELSSRNALGLSYIDTPDDALASEHLAARGLWRKVDGVKLPGPLWLSSLDDRP